MPTVSQMLPKLNSQHKNAVRKAAPAPIMTPNPTDETIAVAIMRFL